MKKYILFFLLSFLLISNKSSAQASLGISQYAYTIYNDTVSAYTWDSIDVFVVNKGTATFNNTFVVNMSVQDSAATSYHTADSASSFVPVLIPPGDSVPMTIQPYYGIDSTQYHYEINVIVIWPYSSGTLIKDSLFFNIYILLPASQQEIDLTHLIKAYPNPAINNILLENTGKNAIEEVRIYNLQGQLIESLKKPDIVCTEKWAPGTYIINILLENKKTHSIRVIKQ